MAYTCMLSMYVLYVPFFFLKQHGHIKCQNNTGKPTPSILVTMMETTKILECRLALTENKNTYVHICIHIYIYM